jgi:hypothetical protein
MNLQKLACMNQQVKQCINIRILLYSMDKQQCLLMKKSAIGFGDVYLK